MKTNAHLHPPRQLCIRQKNIAQKYKGGCDQFRIDWKIDGDNYHQEDDELFSIALLNIDEIDIDKLKAAGLEVNEGVCRCICEWGAGLV